MANVFISYSSQSVIIARTIYQFLSSCHFFVWIDYDSIRGGDLWEQKLYEGLSLCDTVVVLVDPHSMQSQWVRKEVAHARERGASVFPLIVAPFSAGSTALSALETIGVSDVQAIDLVHDLNAYDKLWKRIVEESKNSRQFFKLIRLIRMETSDIHTQALISDLAELNDSRATPYLIKMIERGDEFQSVKWSAIDALGKLRDHRAIPVLTCFLNRENPAELKEVCVKALAKIGGTEALNAICNALFMKDVSYSTIQSLACFHEQQATDALIRFVNLSDREITYLFDSSYSSSYSPRQTANRLRTQAVEVIGIHGHKSAIPFLSNLLAEHRQLDKDLLVAIIRALEKIGDPRPVSLLVEIARIDYYDHQVRGRAIIAIGAISRAIGGSDGLQDLIDLLEDASVTPYAVEALELLGDQRAVPYLKTSLDRLRTDRQYTEGIPQEQKRAYLRATSFVIVHALFSLGHRVDSYEQIWRSYLQ